MMCDIWKTTSDTQIGPSQVERILPDIERLGVQWVVLSGGEALMNAELFDICQLLRTLRIRITLLSTGLLLAKHAASVCKYIDDVIVSLDGPPAVHDRIRRVTGAFAGLQNGIRILHEINPSFSISARCTVQQANHASLAKTVEWAYRLGLQSISFLAADVTSEAFNRPAVWPILKQNQIALTESQIDILREQFTQIEVIWRDSGFVIESPKKLQRIVQHFRAHAGLSTAKAPVCNAPWVSAVIEADGAVRPCFFHQPIGSIHHGGLLQVLNGPQAIAFRDSLDVATNPTCQSCVCSLNWKS